MREAGFNTSDPNGRRAGLDGHQQSRRLMPPTLGRMDRRELGRSRVNNRDKKLDHWPVPRVCGRLVGLTVPFNIEFVKRTAQERPVPTYSPLEASDLVARGFAVWGEDVDIRGNVRWEPYLTPGLYWGDYAAKLGRSIFREFTEDYGFGQRDMNECFGENAPVLKYLAGYELGGEWIILPVDHDDPAQATVFEIAAL